ncbi:MAG: hypothetical protein IK125_08075 [Lachnospiraceae bacterium]|nr:hypothetical protein [Lachnospiraceae bacterium]
MGEYKKMAVFTLIANLLLWGLLTAADYMKEKKSNETATELFLAVLAAAMILVIVMYIRVFSGSRASKLTLQEIVLEKGVWLAVSAVFAFPIVHMINERTWFIKQDTTRLLNGFEYLVIAFAFAAYAVVFSAIDLACRWWSRRNKSKNGDRT